MRELGDQPGSSEFNTNDVCTAYIKQKTQQHMCAFIDLYHDKCDESGKPYVGAATVFVSHAWKYVQLLGSHLILMRL
jgi:hypothetical protein